MVRRRSSLINKSVKMIREEIGFFNEIASNLQEILDNSAFNKKSFKKLSVLSKLESRIEKFNTHLFSIMDSLSDSSSKKKLVLNSKHLVELRFKLINNMNFLKTEFHVNFLGNLKGKLFKDINHSNVTTLRKDLEKSLHVVSVIIIELSQIREDFLIMQRTMDNKAALGSDIDVFDESASKKNIEYKSFFHATDNKSHFNKDSLLKEKDFFFSDRISDAKAQKAGFSGGNINSFRVVRIDIPKKLLDRYVKPYTVSSYSSGNPDCFCFNKHHIKEINNLIRQKIIRLN